MLIFANPEYLYLLIPVLLILPVFALLRRLRSKRIRRFGDENSVKGLMPSSSRIKPWVRIILFTLALAFFVVGIARPQTGAKLVENKIKGTEVMVCLDVSNSMLAEDFSPNRLERAKLAISRFVDQLEGDRIGLIIFAGESFVQLPITADYVSAKSFLNTVNTGSIPVQGTAIGDAIRLAIRSFSAQSSSSRAIIIISDGENHEDDAVAMAKDAGEMGIKIYTVGVGTPEGKAIPMNGRLLTDRDGNMVVSKLDEACLMDIAKVGKGAYVRSDEKEFGLNPIINDIKNMEKEELSSISFEEYDEIYMYFFGVSLLLFVIELLIGLRRWKFNMFK